MSQLCRPKQIATMRSSAWGYSSTMPAERNGFDSSAGYPFGATINGSAEPGDGYFNDEDVGGVESDDPTNTAMCLDENDEKELHGVAPNTPMAFEKLGQLTAKSISRQKVAQTPGKTRTRLESTGQRTETAGSARASTWYTNTSSPSKKGRQNNNDADLLSSAIPRLTPKRSIGQSTSAQNRNRDDEVDASTLINRIRARRDASDMLGRIRMRTHGSKISTEAPQSSYPAENKNALNDTNPSSRKSPQVILNSEPGQDILSPSMIPKPRILFPLKEGECYAGTSTPDGQCDVDERCKTPENKRPPAAIHDTPYNLLRTLSEKSDRSQASAQGEYSNKKDANKKPLSQVDPFAVTPNQRKRTLSAMSTPKTEHRDRINTLRKFFFKTDNGPQPSDIAELVGFATPVQIKSYSGMVVDPDLDSKQPKHGDLVYPPGQVVQITSVDRTSGSSNVPTSPSPIRRNIASTTRAPLSTLSPINDSSDSVSSLLVDLADEDQNQDENKPIPFVLNQGVGNPHLNPNNSGSCCEQSLKTLSMRLNSSIAAINCGLREQLEGGKELAGCRRDDIGVFSSTMDNATGQLNQSLASLISGTNAEHISFGKHSTLKNSKLELQLETLRRSMEDTKSIVFAIQKEMCRIQQQEHGQKLDQQHDNHQQLPNDSSSEDSKLDNILGLLGALDMRLHMIEGRQRLEQNASTVSQRSNTGSTKVYANSRQQGSVQEQFQSQNRQQDIISRIGQLAVHCLNRYPLMIIGMLFIILLSELLIIGGYSLSTQSMRGIGKYALNEVKRHIPVPPQPPS